MTKEEIIAKRDAKIDQMIDRYHMIEKCGQSRERLHRRVQRSMVLNNMAFVFADVANSLLMDAEAELRPFGASFGQTDKYNFKQMLSHIVAAKKWAAKSALPIYELKDEAEDACADSDWWYHLCLLIDDRVGDNPRKTNIFLEFLLGMPSEVGLFNVTYNDFKQFKTAK